MDGTTWDGPRRPVEDEGEDEARRDRYWVWSMGIEPTDDVAPLGEPVPGVTLHRVATHAQADHEARHMRHSVGYNFDHYAAMGDILSLRRGGVPFVTALVSDRVIVHAVRACNEIVTDDDRAVLQVICDHEGWMLPSNEMLQGAHAGTDEDASPEPT